MSVPQDGSAGPANVPRTPNPQPRRRSNPHAPTYIPIEGALSSSPASFSRNIARSVSPSRSIRDYFSSAPQGGSSWLSTAEPRREEWTVFGQLLENDRTPGLRGSDTPSPSQLRTSPARVGRPSLISSTSSRTIPSEPSRISGLASVAEDTDPTPRPTPRNTVYEEPPQLPSEQSRVSVHLEYNSDQSDDESFVSTVPSTGKDPPIYGIFAPPSFYERATARLPTLTPLQKNILKCAIAYFIGSLFTYVPALADLVSDLVPLNSSEGPSPSGHMVATVVVYFNPAKTIGSMLEADIYCLVAALFSSAVCLAAFGLFWFFEEKPGLEIVAGTSVFLCIGLAMTGVAWAKVWMERPSFNTACSMTSIILFLVVVREGGASLLAHVLFIVLLGSVITNLVCFALWRESAATKLEQNMAKVLDSFATVLDMTTRAFLLDESQKPNFDKILRAVEEHQASFTSLKRNLSEAKSEWTDYRVRAAARDLQGSEHELYDAAVEGMTRIAQHLNGLRDGTRLQNEISELENSPSPNGKGNGVGNGKSPMSEEQDPQPSFAMFEELLEDVGPPLEALSATIKANETSQRVCTSSLKSMRDAFRFSRRQPEGSYTQVFQEVAKRIERALFTFERTSNQAVLRFFRKADESEKVVEGGNGQAVSLHENEGVFLVYFFIFTLQEFARELSHLTEVIGAIKQSELDYLRRKPSFLTRLLSGVKRTGNDFLRDPERFPSSEPAVTKATPRKSIARQLSTLLPVKQQRQSAFPKIRPHAPNTIQTPAPAVLSITGRIKHSFWRLGARLRETDLKYAIKSGFAIAILALPAIIESTRPYFLRYRGEWALISCFVVLSPTIGQTNFLSVHRIGGTILGAMTAAGIYTLFSYNPYVLSVFGAFFSMPCFYYIIAKPQYATSARFVLLAYNLTALFCYNVRGSGGVDPLMVAIRRAAAVTVGVVWANIVSRYWWPIEARRELMSSLSDFCLNLGWLYTKLVETYSVPPQELAAIAAIDEDGHRKAVDHLTASVHKFMSMELHLQLSIIKLQNLLSQTQHEPRLKGPFPIHLYRTILTSLQVLLDKLHTMRCVTTKEEWYTTVRRDFIIPVNKERREMVGSVILYFSVLASSFRLKRALPPYLPPAEKARQRLVYAIRQLDVVKRREITQSHHLLYFAYALMMKSVIRELDFLGKTVQDAFGVIGQTVEHFEGLFLERPEELDEQ
ncbi:hypothetical protein FRC01_000025 [Tulasnella sp. 417]|nr:hypothetical protein FRC01_000025 [Tulasnella sp. 417]